jgi:ABC-2 type transport system permease protein
VIHDQSYRHYTGQRTPHGRAWLVIARAGVKAMLRDRRFLGLMLLAWGPFVVRAVQVYVSATFQQASFLVATPATFREYLSQQEIFIFFINIYVGAGLIADDRRANALQIYLAKPLTRAEYLAGKAAVLLLFLVGVTWLPAMLLLAVQVAFNGSEFVRGHFYLIPAITLFCAIQILVSAFAMLALSSLSNSRRFVAIMYAGIVFFTSAVAGAVRTATRSGAMSWISPEASLEVVGDAIFQLPASARDMPLGVAFLALAVLLAGALVILGRRVRAVEVVA